MSRACREAVYEHFTRLLIQKVSRVKFLTDNEHQAGAALFNPPIEPAAIIDWEKRHGVSLPSHIRLLLGTIGAAKHADRCGYSVNPANTWRAMADWLHFPDIEAMRAYDDYEWITDFLGEADSGRYFPSPPMIVVGEAPDDYCQMISLNLEDGYLYHATGNLPANDKVGTSLDYVTIYSELMEGEYSTGPPNVDGY